MSKTQFETRAKRIMSKATALGFTKNGAAMVIDQAREILAAEEGHRNWHALRASLAGQPQQSTSACDPVSALQAIVSRIQGVFDDPYLVAFGPLRTTDEDVLVIAQQALAGAARVDRSADVMLQALEAASLALDQMAQGADFDRVVDETGVTYQVLSAIREAKAARKEASKGSSIAEGGARQLFYAEVADCDGVHAVLLSAATEAAARAGASRGFVTDDAATVQLAVLGGVNRDVHRYIGLLDGRQGKTELPQGGRPAPASSSVDGDLTAEQRKEATGQGWNLFDADGEPQVQRDDEQSVFDDDSEAWLFVLREAKRNPESAAAKALALVRRQSPAEYARVASFDRDNERLLINEPKASSGHPVDLDEVAEWVGIHHKANFHAAGAGQQGWIDRFVAAHEDRFATYLVAHSWEHIFVGRTKSLTRWVFRLGGENEGVIWAQIRGETGRWSDLDRVAMDDIEESVYDNSVPDDYEQWAPDVEVALQLPRWAAPRETTLSLPGNADFFTEILQHRIRWHLDGCPGAPEELPEAEEERIEQLIRDGYNQGEMLVTGSDGETDHRGWWSIDNS